MRVDDADGDGVNGPEANTEESLWMRFPRVCRGPRTWHVCREASKNLGGPIISNGLQGGEDLLSGSIGRSYQAKTRETDG